jgi:hypothetical protein
MGTLESEITLDESKALSFADISRIITGRIHGCSILYVDLETIKAKTYTLERMLGQHDCACLLITAISPGGGVQRHWTVLHKLKNRYYFFDSLALRWPLLDSLIGDTRLSTFLKSIKAVPSTRKLQAHIRKVRTCGCWAAVRCAKYKLSYSEFVKWVTSNRHSTADRTVVKLCLIGLLT